MGAAASARAALSVPAPGHTVRIASTGDNAGPALILGAAPLSGVAVDPGDYRLTLVRGADRREIDLRITAGQRIVVAAP